MATGVIWLLSATTICAATDSKTWVGGNGTLTTTAANWSPSGAPNSTDNYHFTFSGANTTVTVETGGSGTQYLTQSILFNAGADAFTINSNSGTNTEDRFSLMSGSTITQSSAANQTLNATVLLNYSTGGLVTVTGAGAGALTLNSVRFAHTLVGDPSPVLYLARNTTLGTVTHSTDRNGQIRVGNGATATFASTGTDSSIALWLGFDEFGNSSTASVEANHADGFTATGQVRVNNVTFQGNRQMTFSGQFTVEGNTNKTLTFTNTSTPGVTLGSSVIQFGAVNGTSSRVVTLDAETGALATISGAISGSASSGTVGITKTGAGVLVLSGTNTYTGSTLVNEGTLIISGSGSINGTSAVTVNGGTLNYRSSVALSRPLNFVSGTLAGTNYTGHDVSIGANQKISPGNSTGTLVSGSQIWEGAGTYLWEINDATGTAGANGWDLLNLNGTLTITANSGSQFNLQIVSLASQVAGQAANFNALLDGAWLIADATSAITTFDASAFNLNLAGFQNAYSGTWSVALGGTGSFGGDSSQIYLTYSAAIPEPAIPWLLTAGLLLAFRRRRARSSQEFAEPSR